MSNTGDDDKGSSSSSPQPNPNPDPSPPNPEQSPSRRRRNMGENPFANSPQRPRHMSNPPRQTTMITYNRPPPPNFPHWPPPPHGGPIGGSGYGFSGPYGFYSQGSTAVPVGGSGSGSGGVLRTGGSAARKRAVRDVSAAGRGGASGGGDGGAGGEPSLNCSVCLKGFASQKALFGHMRSHPDRGWKGAHPPPTFKAEEEFADLPGINLPGVVAAEDGVEQVAVGGEGGVDGADAAVAEGEEAVQEVEQEVAAPAGERRGFRVPDLNEPSFDGDA